MSVEEKPNKKFLVVCCYCWKLELLLLSFPPRYSVYYSVVSTTVCMCGVQCGPTEEAGLTPSTHKWPNF